MKLHHFILIAIGVIGISSCSQDDNEFNTVTKQNPVSRTSLEVDSLSQDSIITPLAVNPDSVKRPITRAYSASDDDYDEYFSTNMWAIRELPITLQARGQANTSNRYLSTNGKGKEITLVGSADSNNQRFYLRILPASSGIPYLIYSFQEKTPISVGQYNSNPNNKILFTLPNESGSLYSAGWDLINSAYRGYFAIQSQSYLGQSDPKNTWSVFYHVLEVSNDNKLGYAQYTKKPQQEFLLKPDAQFELKEIVFDKNTATVSEQTPISVVHYGKNESEERRPFTLKPVYNTVETSSFYEKSALVVSLSNPDNKYYLPTVLAGKFIPPATINPNEERDPTLPKPSAIYNSSSQRIPKTLAFEINGNAKPNSLIEATSYLKNYSVSAKYTATLVFGDRELKITGTWHGTIYTTVRAKEDVIKFFDLNDGEELRMVHRTFSPIIFK